MQKAWPQRKIEELFPNSESKNLQSRKTSSKWTLSRKLARCRRSASLPKLLLFRWQECSRVRIMSIRVSEPNLPFRERVKTSSNPSETLVVSFQHLLKEGPNLFLLTNNSTKPLNFCMTETTKTISITMGTSISIKPGKIANNSCILLKVALPCRRRTSIISINSHSSLGLRIVFTRWTPNNQNPVFISETLRAPPSTTIRNRWQWIAPSKEPILLITVRSHVLGKCQLFTRSVRTHTCQVSSPNRSEFRRNWISIAITWNSTQTTQLQATKFRTWTKIQSTSIFRRIRTSSRKDMKPITRLRPELSVWRTSWPLINSRILPPGTKQLWWLISIKIAEDLLVSLV